MENVPKLDRVGSMNKESKNLNIGLPMNDTKNIGAIEKMLKKVGAYFETETFGDQGVYNINCGWDKSEYNQMNTIINYLDRAKIYYETETFR